MISADILRGYTDTILLRRLADGPSYGYRISQEVRELSGGALELKEATLYTAFRRLEGSGAIRSWWGDEERGARRRYYELTDQGRARLRAECETWTDTRRILDTLLQEAAAQRQEEEEA
ncbi:MAG: helix-turn-helix transcriptional regulator [Clostridia bacterium]|nr:helix-turn-helix transcriptional regulator [Clostridia bacterium]